MFDSSMARKKWGDLSTTERRTIVGVGAAQVLLLGAAFRDLRRRPAHKVRGSKLRWTPVVFVNFIGPPRAPFNPAHQRRPSASFPAYVPWD